MKHRIIAMLIALALCLPCAACAEAQHTVEGLYSVSYDESLYTLDNTSYLYDSTEDYTWLFMLYNDELDIDASMTKLESYEGFSLYSATEEEREGYIKDTLDFLSDYDGQYLSTIDTGSEGAIIPFCLYRCKDDKGEYLLAETVATGYALDFHCYYADASRPVDDALTQALADVLATFTPVR